MQYKYFYEKGSQNNKNNFFSFFKYIVYLVLITLFVFILVISIKKIVDVVKFYSDKRYKMINYQKYFNSKRYLEIIEKIDNDINEDPYNYQLLIYRGLSYFFLGDEEKDFQKQLYYYNLSLLDIRKALAINKQIKFLKDLYFVMGKIYYYKGNIFYNQSMDYFERALKEGSNRNDLLYFLSIVYSKNGRYKDAIKLLELSLEKEKKDLTYLSLGTMYMKISDYDNAINKFNEVIKISENKKYRENAFLNLGIIYYEKKDYKKSLEHLDEVLKINDNNSEAYFYRGEIFSYNGDRIRARAEWLKTLEINPSHTEAYRRLIK